MRVFGPDDLPVVGATVSSTEGVSGLTDAAGGVTLADLGGTTSTLTITDAEGRLWPLDVPDVAVPTLGGSDLAVALAGRRTSDQYRLR